MTLDRQAEVEAWLREHEPTRCPVAAVGVTTATISNADAQWLHSLPPPQKAKGRKKLPFHERPVAPAKAGAEKPKKATPEKKPKGPPNNKGRLLGSRTDLAGKRFGLLEVLGLAPHGGAGVGYMWLCKCDCGTTKAVRGYDIKRGRVRSCGCRKGHERSYLSEIGKRYGPVVVLAGAPSSPFHKAQRRWLCRCDCGDEFTTITASLHRWFKTEGCSGQHRAWKTRRG